MTPGKKICEVLKRVRLDIARANDIEYSPTPCDHKGDCDGTCPACESEVRYLERRLRARRSLGKAALVAGVTMGLLATAAPAEAQKHKRTPTGNRSNTSPTRQPMPEKKTRGVPAPRGKHPARPRHEQTNTTKTNAPTTPPAAPELEYPDVILTEPMFPGGEEALQAFIAENLRFPEGVEPQDGSLLLVFKVDAEGKANSPHVANSTLPDEYGLEAMRLVSLMPAFVPGTFNGVREEQWYSVPVEFKTGTGECEAN